MMGVILSRIPQIIQKVIVIRLVLTKTQAHGIPGAMEGLKYGNFYVKAVRAVALLGVITFVKLLVVMQEVQPYINAV